jgi:AcrR family transcriptional regulator
VVVVIIESQPARRLGRAQRREQILAAATAVFARGGFAATNVDDVARHAGVSRVILYRHFESKKDLYDSVLDWVCARLAAAVAGRTETIVDALVAAAAADPDGFRLLFRHAAREPEFRDRSDLFMAQSVVIAHGELSGRIRDPDWADWAARLAPLVAAEAVLSWLDAGCPDPVTTPARIKAVLAAVVDAAVAAPEECRS